MPSLLEQDENSSTRHGRIMRDLGFSVSTARRWIAAGDWGHLSDFQGNYRNSKTLEYHYYQRVVREQSRLWIFLYSINLMKSHRTSYTYPLLACQKATGKHSLCYPPAIVELLHVERTNHNCQASGAACAAREHQPEGHLVSQAKQEPFAPWSVFGVGCQLMSCCCQVRQ